MVDMAFLRKKDLDNSILTYRRKKNGQRLFVKWEPCMQEIVDRYNIPESPYLLPIIVKSGVDERKQYINASHRINRHLKTIGKELGLSVPLTHYVARHSWATIARNDIGADIDNVAKGLNHASALPITDIYIKPDWGRIDELNRRVIDFVLYERLNK